MMGDAELAMNALRRLVRALRSGHAGEVGNDLGAAQQFVLRQVAAEPGLSLTALTRRTLTGASAASEVVSKLVAAGLITRANNAEDHRRVSYALTAAGEAAVRTIPTSVPERLIEAFGRLSAEEQWSLARTLDAWIAAAALDDVPASMFFAAGDEFATTGGK